MADETLLADGFEEAFVGYFQRCGQPTVACYNYEKAVDILIERDGMSDEDAREYLEFNVVGGWVGAGTPAFLIQSSLDDFNEIMIDS
jgi:hypothetical protein